MPTPAAATVPARAALAGNPSDLYGGAVLAVPVPSLCARVEIADATSTRIVGHADGHRLVEAATAAVAGGPGEIRWTTDIPRAVGLAGSSAIVIATLRALLLRAGESMGDLELALLAQSVETDTLGIVAGIQDRAVQAAAVPVLVDLANHRPVVTRLTPARPLQVAVAWLPSAASDSGTYHDALRQRAGAGTDGAMEELAALARRGADAFAAGDARALADLMAASAATRATVAPLPDEHERLADAVRRAGLSPNSAGSGGAVAAVVIDAAALDRITDALRAIGGDLVVETYGADA